MYLHIHDQLALGELQERFNECFPALKLEFYSESHKRFEPSEKQYQLDNKKRVGEVRKVYRNGAMEIKSWYTVARVEKELKEEYGLHAQVFRSNRKGEWVQTTSSDSLTLQEQSELSLGENLSH
jgi:hypothetical protein